MGTLLVIPSIIESTMSMNLEKLLHELRLQIRSDNNVTSTEQEERITSSINKNIDEKFNFLQKEIEELKQTSKEHEDRLALVEKQIRANNVIFFGVEEGEKSYEDLEQKLISIINRMGVKCEKSSLEVVRRMGKPTNGKVRPINTTLTTYGMKLSILKNKKKLENTRIYIKEDFPPQILEVRKSLQEQLKKEREEGRIAYIRYDKIVVKEPNENKRDATSKKRELEISPPHDTLKLSGNNPESSARYQKSKKNKISTESQSSMKNYVQKLPETTTAKSNK